MRVDQIEIHAGSVDFQYEAVRPLEAKCEAKTAVSKAPTMQDVNLKLQEMAAGIGANAVINVKYDSGISLTSWRSMKGSGLAVKRLSDDTTCPVCAETIKRAATKCRFCGSELSSRSAAQSLGGDTTASQPWSAPAPIRRGPSNPEPLKSSDNSMAPLLWIAGIVVILTILGSLAS